MHLSTFSTQNLNVRFVISVTEHYWKDKQVLYCRAEMTGQHTNMTSLQIVLLQTESSDHCQIILTIGNLRVPPSNGNLRYQWLDRNKQY